MNEQRERLGVFPLIVAGLSYIPLLGVIFGLITILWGLLTKKTGGKKLAIVGGGGVLFTVVIYSALFYFGTVKRGGIYDELRAKLAVTSLTTLVPYIELYKVQNGYYPETLELLQKSIPSNVAATIVDPSFMHLNEKQRNFYYQVTDHNHYYLLGVGPDETPFTGDDLLPTNKQESIGLVIKEAQ